MAPAPAPRYTVVMPLRPPDLWTLLRRRKAQRPRLSAPDRAALRLAVLPLLLVVAAAALANWLIDDAPARAAARHWPRQQILDAIRFVESSDRDDVPDGDQGKAIGPYQIHEVYWRDAAAADPTLGGGYQDCRRRAYAERTVAAYMQHYVPDAWADGDAEIIARVHNGGPTGFGTAATQPYWRRVEAALRR